MGERRKRKSLWDKEAETRPFTGMSEYHNWIGKEKHPSHDSYYQNMSPELKYNHSLDIDRSNSHRYPGRARSRSRSRTRGRSRSRSLSRGMERERARGGSRSRSRSDSDARGWIRSRSPLGDYKHQSSGWSDRRSLPEKSTEICSDFASGRCRRGSQCKYSHPKNTGHRDGGLGGVDTSESRRSWADYSRGPWTESRGDVSDSYHGEDEQFQNNSKNAVPCRNFIKGNCRWGDTCRFSHHVASDETSVEGAKHSSSDKDAEHQPYRNRNPPCKYFAVGKCDRDNCRFSHEDSQFNSLESRRDKVINNDRSSRDKGSRRSGLRWDDAGRISDDVKLSGRNSSVVTVTDSITDYSDSRHNNKVDQRFSSNAWQQNVSQASHIQHQNHGVEENNPVSSFHSDVIDDVKDSRNTTDPVFLFGQNLHQNGENVLPRHLTIPEEAGSEEMSALNRAETHQVANLDLQSQIQKLQMKGMSETNTSLSFPSLATGEHSTQYTSSLLFTALQHVTNPVMFPNPILENEHSGKNAVAEVSDTTGMVHSIENGRSSNEHGNHTGEGNKMSSIAGTGPNNSEIDHSRRSIVQQETAPENPEFDEFKGGIGEQSKGVQDGKHSETLDGLGKADEYANKDDKGMRLFKNSLVEFVKDILKPTWKEGRMSREVHKTIVKKVVDKITSTIQTEHIPKTQEKAEQYLSFSKPKIARLVQAYVDRSSKTDS